MNENIKLLSVLVDSLLLLCSLVVLLVVLGVTVDNKFMSRLRLSATRNNENENNFKIKIFIKEKYRLTNSFSRFSFGVNDWRISTVIKQVTHYTHWGCLTCFNNKLIRI